MTQEGPIPPPPAMWAQRNNIVYLTICLEDCKDPVIDIEPEKIYFKGVGGTEHKMHEVTINLHDTIDPVATVKKMNGRTIDLVLRKKNEGPYWPRLTKEKTKAHWLRSDFNKWKDEDDSDEGDAKGGDATGGDNDLEEMMRQMGGLRGSMNSTMNFGEELDDQLELETGEADSDDDELPDLVG